MTRQRQNLYWLLAFAVFLLAVYLLRSILLPFVLGIAVAYFLDPVADWLERRRLSRTLAATLLTIVFLVGVGLFFALLVPLLQSQLFGFVRPHSRLCGDVPHGGGARAVDGSSEPVGGNDRAPPRGRGRVDVGHG